MTERDALTRAVFAAPDDDQPRLDLADWLDEHGENDPAARIRDWISRLKPAAVRAWEGVESGSDLRSTADELQRADPHTWRLAAVLGQRLEEWPTADGRTGGRLTRLIYGSYGRREAARHRKVILHARHAAELAGYGLPVDLGPVTKSAGKVGHEAGMALVGAVKAAAVAATAALAAAGRDGAAGAAVWAAGMVAESAADREEESQPATFEESAEWRAAVARLARLYAAVLSGIREGRAAA
jgi:uncharacterized protein (TIGR02996 family)